MITYEATTTAGEAEVSTPTVPSSNDEGFNRRMIDHLTFSIESYNRVTARMRAVLRKSDLKK